MSHLWKELHLRALHFPGGNDHIFLNRWAKRIPRYQKGCRCKSFYNLWIRKNQPNFGSYFEWSVSLHNAVNVKLGKPTFTVEQARELYSKMPKLKTQKPKTVQPIKKPPVKATTTRSTPTKKAVPKRVIPNRVIPKRVIPRKIVPRRVVPKKQPLTKIRPRPGLKEHPRFPGSGIIPSKK